MADHMVQFEKIVKKCALMMLLICISGVFIQLPTYADAGPKPSVEVSFQVKGMDSDEVYYVTLLAKETSTGPFAILKDASWSAKYHREDPDYPVFEKFVDYKSKQGFHFLQFFKRGDEDDRFVWSYYPPQTFTILLYFPERNLMIESDETYKRYAFDSYYNAVVNVEANSMKVHVDYLMQKELLSLGVRLLLTVVIELLIAMRYQINIRTNLKLLLWVNLLTQLVLNVALNVVNVFLNGGLFILIYGALELVVMGIEWRIYKKYMILGERPRTDLLKYVVNANASSFVVGLLVASLFPMFF